VVIKKDIKDKGMSLKKFIKRLKFIYRFDDSYIDSLLNELKYEIADEVKTLAVPKIMTEDETLDVLINERKSICRFGDGELNIVNGKDILADETIAKHYEWVEEIKKNNAITPENCEKILQDEIGKVFADILGQCGVYARNEEGKAQFLKFVEVVNE
jgi:NTP pyrophosphatase (non-canonical NTP hydrolase)